MKVIAAPPIADYSLHRWDLLKQAMQEPEPIREILDRVQTTLENNHNVFLVGAFPYRGPVAPVPLAPAPQTSSGWYLQDYLHNWAAQTSFLVLSPRYSKQSFCYSRTGAHQRDGALVDAGTFGVETGDICRCQLKS